MNPHFRSNVKCFATFGGIPSRMWLISAVTR